MLDKFYHLPAPEDNDCNEIVVLVHGLLMRGFGMYVLGRFLNKAGYEIYLYDYPTTRRQIAGHGRDFLKYLERLHTENPGRPINLVTHSLGGIITREVLNINPGPDISPILEQKIIRRIVMVAPPHRGSDIAKFLSEKFPFTSVLIKPLEELSSSPEAYVNLMPVPEKKVEIGIIAGTYDGKVSLDSTHLECEDDHHIIPSSHTIILYRTATKKAVLNFLREGRFPQGQG